MPNSSSYRFAHVRELISRVGSAGSGTVYAPGLPTWPAPPPTLPRGLLVADIPNDVNALLQSLWSTRIRKDETGAFLVAGLSVLEIADRVEHCLPTC